MSATLTQTYEQRMGALEKANEVRLARAQMKRDIAAGKVDLRAVILNPPGYLDGVKVFDLLVAVPGVARKRAETWLRACGYATSWTTVEKFTNRQRAMLIPHLNRHAHTSMRFQRAAARAQEDLAA